MGYHTTELNILQCKHSHNNGTMSNQREAVTKDVFMVKFPIYHLLSTDSQDVGGVVSKKVLIYVHCPWLDKLKTLHLHCGRLVCAGV